MEIIKNSFKQTERIKKSVAAGFRADLSLDFGDVKKNVEASAECRVKSVTPAENGVNAEVRARISVIYLSVSGEIERYESGVDFSLVVPFEGAYVGEPVVDVIIDDVKLTANGGGFSVLASGVANAEFLVENEVGYAEEIDGAVTKKGNFSAYCLVGAKSDVFEAEEEKNYPFVIKKIISSRCDARVCSVQCGIDCVIYDCEAASELLFLTDSGEQIRETAAFTFRFEQEFEGVSPELFARGAVRVNGCSYKVETAEDSAGTTVNFLFGLKFFGEVYRVENREFVEDCFSLSHETDIERENRALTVEMANKIFKLRVIGEAICEKTGEIKKLARSEICDLSHSYIDGKLEVSGILKSVVLFENEGEIAAAPCKLPFSVSFPCDGQICCVECFARGVAVKEFDGKIIAECEITVCALEQKQDEKRLIINAEAGEEKKSDDCAVRVIFVKKGESAWDVCKKAGVSERELLSGNPDAEFPASADYSVTVYRRIEL